MQSFIGAKLEILDGAVKPRRAHDDDAGLDIAIQDDVTIYPGESAYMPAGVKLDIPDGFAAHVMTRSSTFRKRVQIIPSVIDSNYKGEISTIVTNNNTYPVSLKRGDYLAQVVIMPYFKFDNEDGNILAPHLNRDHDEKFGSSDHKN